MAKRHHNSKHHEGFYEGIDERRHQEHADASMIPSGHGSHANMPGEVIMKEYSRPHGYSPENLDDTIHGIDNQIGHDNSQKHRGMKPTKV